MRVSIMVLGCPFPALLRRARNDEARAALWGINGLASVGAAALAPCLAFLLGTEATLLSGAALYLAAALLAKEER